MAASLTSATPIRTQPDVLFQDLEGEGVLLNLQTGIYFGLDRVGTRIWQLMETPTPVADIVRTIVEEFDVSPERCTSDVLALATSMAEHGLIAIG